MITKSISELATIGESIFLPLFFTVVFLAYILQKRLKAAALYDMSNPWRSRGTCRPSYLQHDRCCWQRRSSLTRQAIYRICNEVPDDRVGLMFALHRPLSSARVSFVANSCTEVVAFPIGRVERNVE